MAGTTGNNDKSDRDDVWLLVVFLIPILAAVLYLFFPPPASLPKTLDTFKSTGSLNWALLLLVVIAAVLYILEQFMPENRRPLARRIRWFCIILLVPLVLLGYFHEPLKTFFGYIRNIFTTLFGYVRNTFNTWFGYDGETLADDFRRWFVVVTGAFLAIYPITFLAYEVNVHPRLKRRLKNEIKLLGLDDEDSKLKNEALVDETFKSRHFWLFIIPIIVVSLVIVLGFLFPDKLPGNRNIEEPMQLVFFSLLGAYVFSVQELVRRYQTNDLRPHVYATILVRIVIATTITFAAATIIGLAGAEVACLLYTSRCV